MNQMALSQKETAKHICQVACRLAHPCPVWFMHNPGNVHPASRQLDDEKNVVRCQGRRLKSI